MFMPKKHIKIVLTGGGTGGHVIPTLAVAAALKKAAPQAELYYVGSRQSIEERLAIAAGIPFHAVTVGKLRRYFSLQNVIDAIKVPIGVLQAVLLLRQLQPDIVFAKGGYVSVPVAVAAGWLKIPLITHESDVTPGLATKINARYAAQVCVSFEETKRYLKKNNVVHTGNPVRPAGNAARGRKFLGFGNRKPILLVTGGSSGAAFLNMLVETDLTEILRAANLVWITGGKAPRFRRANCKQFDFLGEEYPDVLAASTLVLTRAGANSLFELAMAKKPALLIPLPCSGSRGDQILNGRYFARAGAAVCYEQDHIRPLSFAADLAELLKDKKKLAELSHHIATLAPKHAAKQIAQLILNAA